MKHIKTLDCTLYKHTINGGCGECQTSCQSACKTSCTLANQSCENGSYGPKDKATIIKPKSV